MTFESQDKSVEKIQPILNSLDYWVLSSMFSISQQTKSTALALALLYRPEEFSVQEIVDISRLDINY